MCGNMLFRILTKTNCAEKKKKKESVLYVETVTVKRVMHYVWKHFRMLTKTSCVVCDVILVLKIVSMYLLKANVY